jgi:hypothetical protein
MHRPGNQRQQSNAANGGPPDPPILPAGHARLPRTSSPQIAGKPSPAGPSVTLMPGARRVMYVADESPLGHEPFAHVRAWLDVCFH